MSSPMFPGAGGMDPRQLKQMMKKLGIEVEEIPDVREVRVVTDKGTYVVKDASVTKMTAKGEETLQVQGKITEGEPAKSIAEQDEGEDAELEISDEDVQLVMDQTGAKKAEATQALEEAGGNPAEAIIALSSGGGD